MRLLSLYAAPPVAAVEAAPARDLDPDCRLCPLHEGVKTVCVGAEGEPGGVLFVGEGPGKTEDREGRPFVGASGKLLRMLVARWWSGPVAIDNSTRCAPFERKVTEKHVGACRGYLTQTIEEVRPQRIVALGAKAALSIFGRAVPPLGTRRGYGYLVSGRFGPDPIPVFIVLHPAAALRNRFLRAWLEEDLEWALTCSLPALPPLDALVHLVEDESDAREARAALERAPWAAYDVEAAGLQHTPSYRLLSAAFCAAGSEDPFVWGPRALRDAGARRVLTELLRSARVKKTGANVKYDDLASKLALGTWVGGIRGDVRLWRKLVDPEAPAALDAMMNLVGMGGAKEEAEEIMAPLVHKIRRGQDVERRLATPLASGKPRKVSPDAAACLALLERLDEEDPEIAKLARDKDVEYRAWSYALLPEDALVRYNGRDAVATARVTELVEPQVDADPGLAFVRREIVDRAERAVSRVEAWGVGVDLGALRIFDSLLEVRLSETWQQIEPVAGKDFNPNSTPQLRELLFGKLGLKPSKKTGTGLDSTDEEVLTELAPLHSIAHALMVHRGLTKMRGTYASGMLPHVRPDGRIHPSILLDGAATGRSSCRDPNLQNIPRPADPPGCPDALKGLGKMARDVFVSLGPGRCLVEADYSQLELRVLAMLSGDPEMLKIYLEGVDYHLRTAQLVCGTAWGIRPEQVNDGHRTACKTAIFATIYGAGAGNIAEQLGISYAQAQRIQDAIMGHFKVARAWLDRQARTAERTGYVHTWWAGRETRRRSLYLIADQDSAKRNNAKNASGNTPIQGTASEFCIRSLAECVEWIEGDGLGDQAKLVLPIHDALMFEAREGFADELVAQVRGIMLSHDTAGMPFEVDFKVGRAWGSLKKLKRGQRVAEVLYAEA